MNKKCRKNKLDVNISKCKLGNKVVIGYISLVAQKYIEFENM